MSTPLGYNFLQVFWAMLVGWLAGYLFYAVRMVHFSDWHRVTDFSAVFFFTALFAGLSAVTVVPLLFWLLRRLGLADNMPAFVALMTVSGPLALLLLLLPFGGKSLAISVIFAMQAAVTGAMFALAYLGLRHYLGAGGGWPSTAFLLASPLLALLFLFYGLPYLAPSLAFTYFGDAIADRAARHVLARYRVGDRVSAVSQALPGLMGEGVNDSPGSGGYFGGSTYHVVYRDGVITELNLTQ